MAERPLPVGACVWPCVCGLCVCVAREGCPNVGTAQARTLPVAPSVRKQERDVMAVFPPATLGQLILSESRIPRSILGKDTVWLPNILPLDPFRPHALGLWDGCLAEPPKGT